MKNKIVIVGGDPNSINSEILFKTWKRLNARIKKKIYLIANYQLICKQYKKLNFKTNIIRVKNINDNNSSSYLKVINIPLNFKNSFRVSLDQSSRYTINSLELAHKLGENDKVKGIINCPINKKLIKKTNKIGVTEFFSNKCKVSKNSEVMVIYNKKLSVVPLTTHINIKDVSKIISSKLIIKKVTTLNKKYKQLFKKKPKIGILGLNPHNAEFNKNSEENLKILPAISKLKKKGVNIKGPLVTDTIFVNNYKKYDVIVGMYHDQVLTPFKTLFKYNAINLTLGLNYIRVSPDHGPGIDLIRKNKANYSSLFQCVKFINNLN